MKVIEKRTIRSAVNGEYLVQLEDWSEDYPSIHAPADQLAAYPVAKADVFKEWNTYPRRGEKFRLGIHFSSEKKARKAMEALEDGTKTLKDFSDKFDTTPNLNREQLVSCL